MIKLFLFSILIAICFHSSLAHQNTASVNNTSHVVFAMAYCFKAENNCEENLTIEYQVNSLIKQGYGPLDTLVAPSVPLYNRFKLVQAMVKTDVPPSDYVIAHGYTVGNPTNSLDLAFQANLLSEQGYIAVGGLLVIEGKVGNFHLVMLHH